MNIKRLLNKNIIVVFKHDVIQEIDFTYEIFKDFEKENELIDNKEIYVREKKLIS